MQKRDLYSKKPKKGKKEKANYLFRVAWAFEGPCGGETSLENHLKRHWS